MLPLPPECGVTSPTVQDEGDNCCRDSRRADGGMSLSWRCLMRHSCVRSFRWVREEAHPSHGQARRAERRSVWARAYMIYLCAHAPTNFSIYPALQGLSCCTATAKYCSTVVPDLRTRILILRPLRMAGMSAIVITSLCGKSPQNGRNLLLFLC